MATVAQASDTEKMEVPASEEEASSDREESMTEEESEEFTVQLGATYSCKRQDGTYHDAKVTKTRMNKRAGREEFYVNYVGLNCRLNEWVDKTRLVLVKPMEEEEDVENDTDAETSANGNAPLKEKTLEDEPVSKKPKVEVQETSTSSSVVAPEDLAEALTCLLCNQIFGDPVVVECGHNFCRSCIDEAWKGQDSFSCPDCKEVITDKRYTHNRILANLVKKTIGVSVSAPAAVPAAVSTPAKSVAKEKAQPTGNCLIHDERLKLFCKDDGDLGCVICRESLKHSNHNFLPILDAMGVYREELSSIVTPLEEALKMAEQLAKQQNEKIERHRANILEYRAHIEAEFEKMRKLLKEREERLLGKLQEEGGSLLMEMEANIAKMQENIESIKKSIATASEKLEDKDSISFLTDIKAFIKKCQEQQKEALSSGNTIIDKQLNRETYMAPIDFSVSEEIKEVKITPASKPKEIWIIGGFMVLRAAVIAKNLPCGKNLGFEEKSFTVRWISKVSMEWRQLWTEVSQGSVTWGDPVAVFFNLGDREIGKFKLTRFVRTVNRDFTVFTKAHPNTAFIWAPILPRDCWQGTRMEENRKQFNCEASSCAEKCGVEVAELSEVEEIIQQGLKRKERVHWKDESFNVLEAFIKVMMTSINKAIHKKGNVVNQETV